MRGWREVQLRVTSKDNRTKNYLREMYHGPNLSSEFVKRKTVQIHLL